MEEKKKNKNQPLKASQSGNDAVPPPSPSPSPPPPSQAFLLHLICGLGLASAFWVAQNLYSINLVTYTSQTLRLIWVIEAPIVILLYSLFRQNPNQCSYLKAVGRGMLGLPAGAVVCALGAIALGAPVGIRYFAKTLNWSLLMSLLTVLGLSLPSSYFRMSATIFPQNDLPQVIRGIKVLLFPNCFPVCLRLPWIPMTSLSPMPISFIPFVPAASVFGSSWTDWQRIFAHTKPIGSIDYMICLPAHGAVIGAWFGAWPMPLDWERPWQEWPICVSYGAMAGYWVSMVVSFGFVVLRGGRHHVKGD